MGVFSKRREKSEITEKASISGSSGEDIRAGVVEIIDAGTVDVSDSYLVDDSHSRHYDYLQLKHYAKIQREYEGRSDWDGLKQEQQRQLVEDPFSNLSPQKLDYQRYLRRARVVAVFFLILTDTLGPSNAPYAISQAGLVPGIILYVAFGVFAVIGGYFLQLMYVRLDSDNFPLRTYSDLASRMIGPWCRWFIGSLQFIQLILNVGVVILGSGQSLAQIIKSTYDDPKLCFSIQVLVWALLGMVFGQIQSLHHVSYIGNFSIWLSISVCIVTMVGAATGPPNYKSLVAGGLISPSQVNDPIQVVAATTTTFSTRMQGVSQLVFAWAGATMFCEIMAEMKQPKEFVKSMVGSQAFMLIVYLFYGVFVYCYQGQFTDNPGNQGISQYKLQTAANVLYMVSGILSCGLYGNVSVKIFYQGFGVSDLKFPALNTKKGRILWTLLIILYWGIAFVIGSAIPQVSNLISFIGALCILNFSYTFPFTFMLAMMLRDDAGSMDKYDPETGTVAYHDSWGSWPRWRRAIFNGGRLRLLGKATLLALSLGALSLCGLGLYGSLTSMIALYKLPTTSSFGCKPTA